MAKISKRYKKAVEGVDVVKAYSIEEAVKLIKSRATAKFDETIELAMNLGVDPAEEGCRYPVRLQAPEHRKGGQGDAQAVGRHRQRQDAGPYRR